MTLDTFTNLAPGDRVYMKSPDMLPYVTLPHVKLDPEVASRLGTLVTIRSVSPDKATFEIEELPGRKFGLAALSYRVPSTAQELANFLGF